jgi:hypothetical protein
MDAGRGKKASDKKECHELSGSLACLPRHGPPDPQREWAALIIRITAEIQTILRRSRPKAEHYPTDIDCYRLAHLIEAVRVVNAKKKRQPSYRASALLECARKFVRELDKSLNSARDQIPPNVPAEILDAIIDQHYPHIREMEEAKRAAEAVVTRCEGEDPPNPARSIRDALQEAWQRAGAPITVGVKPKKDPLCREVTELLKLAGIHYEESTVSGMLRGLEKRRRSGGGRKSTEKVPA